jgi:hypothetical protein
MAALFAIVAAGQERFVRPVDEAAKDRSFLAFRTKLISAAERKDAKYIYSILDPNIKLSFGGEEGIADLKNIWKPESKDTRFWDEFLPVIRTGGAFTGVGRNRLNSFTAPYTFSSWPDDIDGFEYHAIFGNNVNLREGPSMDAKVLGRLSYNVIKVIRDADEFETEDVPGWYRIETMGGMSGYVSSKYVRSHLDYRAGFEKKRGVWKMTFFIAGD